MQSRSGHAALPCFLVANGGCVWVYAVHSRLASMPDPHAGIHLVIFVYDAAHFPTVLLPVVLPPWTFESHLIGYRGECVCSLITSGP